MNDAAKRPEDIVDRFYPTIAASATSEDERRKAFMVAMTLAWELGWEACEEEFGTAWYQATGTILNLQKHD